LCESSSETSAFQANFRTREFQAIEEANFITETQFNILTPTIRASNSEVWLSFNPKEKTDYIYKRFVLKDNDMSVVRKINYTDNPYAPITLIQEAENTKNLDIALYKHIYLGNCLDDSINKFFRNVDPSSHRLKEYKRIYIGFDVADDAYNSGPLPTPDLDTLNYIK